MKTSLLRKWLQASVWSFLFFAASLCVPDASRAVAAEPVNARLSQLQQAMNELELRLAGRRIDVSALDEAGLKSLFNADLTRLGFRGIYRLQIEPDGRFSVWYSGGQNPAGATSHAQTWIAGGWNEKRSQAIPKRVLQSRVAKFARDPAAPPAPDERLDQLGLTDLQEMIDQLGLKGRDGNAVSLKSLSIPDLFQSLRGSFTRPGFSGTYFLQIEPDEGFDEVTVWYSGGAGPDGNNPGVTTFRQGKWRGNEYHHGGGSAARIEALLYRTVRERRGEPAANVGATPVEHEPFYLTGIDLSTTYDALERTHLTQHPADADKIAEIQRISADLSKQMRGVEILRDGLAKNDQLLFKAGLFLSPDNRDEVQELVREITADSFQLKRKIAQDLLVAERIDRGKTLLLGHIQSERMRELLKAYPSFKTPDWYKAEEATRRLEMAAPHSALALHLRFEAVVSAPKSNDRATLKKGLEELQQTAQSQFGVPHPESIQLASLTRKALKSGVRWSPEEKQMLLKQALLAAENSLVHLASRPVKEVSIKRVAECHDLIMSLLEEGGSLYSQKGHGSSQDARESLIRWHAKAAYGLRESGRWPD